MLGTESTAGSPPAVIPLLFQPPATRSIVTGPLFAPAVL
jgi:hypothetical protein